MMLRAKGRVRNGILQLIVVDGGRLHGYSKRVHKQHKAVHQEILDVPSFMKHKKYVKEVMLTK